MLANFLRLDFISERPYLWARNIWRLFRCGFALLSGDMSVLPKTPVQAKRCLTLRQKPNAAPISVSPLPDRESVWQLCLTAHRKTGVWPISFSYPLPARPPSQNQNNSINPVYPGHPYSFELLSEYMDSYSRHAYALTHRKSGWDCFRHVEILASGSVPFMPDASLIPDYTMVHYPKLFLVEVANHLLTNRGTLSTRDRESLHRYFDSHLTSSAMASYLLRASPAVGKGKVLFVDYAIEAMPDYQSVLTLIGLKQVMGDRVIHGTPVPYIYQDWTGDAGELYGRGFGYTRVLPKEVRTARELSDNLYSLSAGVFTDIDLLVVGSITRNFERALNLLRFFPASRTVWIHGEDEGPTAAEITLYKEFGVTVFVRELSSV